jgi:hypothetical protein
VEEEIAWHIGKDASDQERIDVPPYKAYFYWKREGQIIRSAEYTESELRAEIERLRSAGKDVAPFELALKRLS